MEDFLLDVLSFISMIPVSIILLGIFLIGMYVFWRGCVETGKNESSTFDIYTISLLVGVILGRVGYILSNIKEFTSSIWYWSPYEKYGDTVYIFRLLPWRFIRIWDGGIVIFVLFVGFVLFATVFVLFMKKWRWKHLFFTIFFSGIFILFFSLLFTASVTIDLETLLIAGILLSIVIIFFVSSLVVSRMKIKWRKRKKIIGYIGTVMVWLTAGYLSYVFLLSDVSTVEVISVYALDIWVILSTIIFVIDMKRKKVKIEKISSVQSVSLPEINQPIRFPLDEKK